MSDDLKIGDKILITSDKLGSKSLGTVEKGEVVIITGFSEDGKIMYHHGSLALPVNSNIYITLKND